MLMSSGSPHERQARLGVLDDLIKYMRKMELAKDEPVDALGEGLGAVADKMSDENEEEGPDEARTDPNEAREMEDGEEDRNPEAVLEIEAGPKEEMAEHEEGEELSPFQQKMKDYFNNRDRPKVGKSMSFIMATKTPAAKSTSVMDVKRRGKPFKR